MWCTQKSCGHHWIEKQEGLQQFRQKTLNSPPIASYCKNIFELMVGHFQVFEGLGGHKVEKPVCLYGFIRQRVAL